MSVTARLAGAALAALLIAVPLAARGATATDDIAARFYEDALRRHAAGDDRGALIQLKNVIQRDPRNIGAHLLKGKIHLKQREALEALNEFDRARQLGADESLVTFPTGEALLIRGAFREILSRFAPSLTSREVSRDVYVLHGFAYLGLRDLDSAERAFEKAQHLIDRIETAREAAATRGMARVLLERGKPEEARRLLAPLVGKIPGDADLWFVMAEISRDEGDLDRALGELDNAVAKDPDQLNARLTRAALLIDRNREAAALEDIAYVRERAPRQADALSFEIVANLRLGNRKAAMAAMEEADQFIRALDHEVLANDRSALFLAGFVNFLRGNLTDASNYLARHLRLAPQAQMSRIMLARIYLKTGAPEDAVTLLRPYARKLKAEGELLAMLGEAYMRLKRYDEATGAFERAIAATSKGGGTLRRKLALSRLATGNYEGAVGDLDAYIESNPGDERAAFMLALMHLRNSRYPDALAAAQNMIGRFPDNPGGYNVAGAAMTNLGDAAGARASFQRALSLDRGFIPARLNLAKLDQHLGDRESAKRRYRAILKERPNESRAMAELARIAEGEGKLREALDWFDKIVRLDRGQTRVHLEIVRLALRANDPDRALAAARAAQEIAPSDADVLSALARTFIARSENPKARDVLQRMSVDQDRSADWLMRIAAMQTVARSPKAAEANLRRAIELKPKALRPRAALVALLVRQNRIADAEAAVRELRASVPGEAEADRLQAEIYMRQARFAEAADLFGEAQRKAPSSSLLLRRASALRAAGRGGETVPEFLSWLEQHPDDSAVMGALAVVYSETGEDAKAIAFYERLIKRHPTDPRLMNNLAILYDRKGDKRALALARDAERLAPDRPTVLDTLGWLLFKSGDAVLGLRYLREAYTRSPTDPEIQYHLAVVLVDRGRTREARRLLESAVASGRSFHGLEHAKTLLERL